MYYQLGGGDLYGYHYNGLNLEDGRPQECTPSKTIFSDGLYFEPVNVSRDGDVYRIFRVCGLCGMLLKWEGFQKNSSALAFNFPRWWFLLLREGSSCLKLPKASDHPISAFFSSSFTQED